MRIRCTKLADGPGPSEAIVSVNTIEGPAEVILDMDLVNGGQIEVGSPLMYRGESVLVELPRETAGGLSRVWLPKTEMAPA